MGTGDIVGGNAYEPVETIKLRAVAARSPGDVVRIGTGHTSGVCTDISLADDTNVYGIAVALESAAVNDIYCAARKGTVTATVGSGTYVVGDGVDILDGATRPSTTAAETAVGATTLNDFGIVVVGGTTVTSIVMTLYGAARTAQT